MKIIFLDIDGVLNNKKTVAREGGFIGIDPDLVKIFNRVVRETGAKVVLSSTWRLDPNWMDVMKRADIQCKFLGRTPHLFRDIKTKEIVPYRNTGGIQSVLRGEEVESWLDENGRPERYAILDDDQDFLYNQPLFRTSFHFGLTEEIANQVIDFLNGKDQSTGTT